VIVQTLVSVGTVGSVFIFGFCLIAFLFILKHLFKKQKEGSPYYAVAVALFSFLGMLLVNSMAEVTILFITRFAMFMFWMYLGYVQTFFDDKKGKGTLFLEDMDEKLKKVFKQK
jgi:amino acid transporter